MPFVRYTPIPPLQKITLIIFKESENKIICVIYPLTKLD